MKAILLAAGRGSRMGEMTAELPKCMAVLRGRRLIEWQIAAIRQAGLEGPTIVGGYRNETIEPYADGFFVNSRWQQTNMFASLCCAEEILSRETCCVSYSDIVYHPAIVEQLKAASGDIVITFDLAWHSLWSARFADPLSDAETFVYRDDRLLAIGGRTTSLSDITGQYMGLLKFTARGWQQVRSITSKLPQEAIDKLDMTSLLSLLLKSDIAIQVTSIRGRWCEVDSQTDITLYDDMIERNEQAGTVWSHDWRWETNDG
jgi:choline kinase